MDNDRSSDHSAAHVARDETTPPRSRSLRATVIRGAGIASGGYLLTEVVTFAFYIALARVAAPEDFGKLAAGSIFVGFATLVAATGMPAAVIQRRDRIEEAASTAFLATVVGGAGFAVVGVALAPLIGLYFRSAEIGRVAAAMCGYLLLRQTIVVPNALLQRRFSFVRRVVVDPASALAFGCSALFLCSRGLGVWGLVLGSYASIAVAVVLTWTLARWRPQIRLVSLEMWRELFAFGKHVTAGELIRRAGGEFSTLLLGRFVGSAALGQFRYAERVATKPLDAFVNTTTYVLFPAFARISHDETRFRRALFRGLRWTSIVVLPASLLLFPLGEAFVVLVFGEPWRDAGRALMAMSAYPVGLSFVALAAQVFKAAARPELLPRMHTVSAALTCAFMLALLPFGLIGVAAAVSLRSIAIGGYAAVRMADVVELPIRRVFSTLWPPLAAAIAMAAVVYALEYYFVDADAHGVGPGLALLLVEAAIGGLIYIAVLAMLAPDSGATIAQAVRVAWMRLRRSGSAQEPEGGEEPFVRSPLH